MQAKTNLTSAIATYTAAAARNNNNITNVSSSSAGGGSASAGASSSAALPASVPSYLEHKLQRAKALLKVVVTNMILATQAAKLAPVQPPPAPSPAAPAPESKESSAGAAAPAAVTTTAAAACTKQLKLDWSTHPWFPILSY